MKLRCELGAGVRRRARRRRRCCRRRSCRRPRAAPAASIASASGVGEPARRLHDEQRARRHQLAGPAAQRRRSARRAGAGRRRPAGRRRAVLRALRTLTRPSCAMSRETVACTASMPSARSASATSACVESGCCWTSRRIVALPLELRRHASTSPSRSSASVASSVVSVSGGVSRSVCSPALPITRPCSSAASTTGRGGPVELDGEQQAERRAPRRTRRGRAQSCADSSRTCASSSSSIVSTTAQAAAHATGLPPNVEAWSPGLEAGRRVVGDEQRADRQAVREPLRERDRVGPHAELLPREEGAACGRRRSAPRRGSAARRARRRARAPAASTSGASGWTPPSPCTGSSRIAAVCGPTCSASVSASRSGARHERLERGALRGLPGDGERARTCGRGTSPRARRSRCGRSPCAPT